MANVSKKELAFALFDQGKRPSDPEVKALDLKSKSTYNYFQEWKKTHFEQNGNTTAEAKGSTITKARKQVRQPTRETNILADAQQIRFVPRVYTTDYTPIMRAAQKAAVEFWGWRPDMPLGNFLDTALHLFFKEHGITLAGYIVSDEAREALEEQQKKEEEHGQEERE